MVDLGALRGLDLDAMAELGIGAPDRRKMLELCGTKRVQTMAPVELEKLERNDPLKRFSEKVAIQKTIVNAGVREASPVRSPKKSAI